MHINIIMPAAVAATIALASCGGGKSAETSAEETLTATEAVAEPAETTPDPSKEMEAIANDIYTNVIFGDGEQELLEAYCTPELLKKLRDAYDFDGDGYAVWLFRTGAQDGDGESKVMSMTPGEENTLKVDYLDMGHEGSTVLVFVRDGETWKIDNLTDPDGKPLL